MSDGSERTLETIMVCQYISKVFGMVLQSVMMHSFPTLMKAHVCVGWKRAIFILGLPQMRNNQAKEKEMSLHSL